MAVMGVAERRPARHGRQGMEGHGRARQSTAGKAWSGSTRQVGEWRGTAGVERLGGACPSVAWLGRRGKVWRGVSETGTARQGMACTFFNGGIMATRTQEDWNRILTAIRDSGIINMWGAPRYLQDEYGISKKKSIDVFSAWKLTFRKDETQ